MSRTVSASKHTVRISDISTNYTVNARKYWLNVCIYISKLYSHFDASGKGMWAPVYLTRGKGRSGCQFVVGSCPLFDCYKYSDKV